MEDSPAVTTLEDSIGITTTETESTLSIDLQLWTRRAIIISIISILVTLVAAISGLVIAIRDGSVSVLGYAFESFLDIITSFLIIWRFRLNTDKLLHEPEGQSRSRDHKAAVLISFLMLIISLIIGIQSIKVLATKEAPDTAKSMIILAAVSILVWVVLGLAKLKIANVLNSSALREDAYVTSLSGNSDCVQVTCASCVLSTGILIGGIAFGMNEKYFWIDGVVALLVSVSLVVSGVKLLYKYRWWHLDFWKA